MKAWCLVILWRRHMSELNLSRISSKSLNMSLSKVLLRCTWMCVCLLSQLYVSGRIHSSAYPSTASLRDTVLVFADGCIHTRHVKCTQGGSVAFLTPNVHEMICSTENMLKKQYIHVKKILQNHSKTLLEKRLVYRNRRKIQHFDFPGCIHFILVSDPRKTKQKHCSPFDQSVITLTRSSAEEERHVTQCWEDWEWKRGRVHSE